MKSRLIPISDRAAWQQALDGLPHAFAHSWEYNYALSRTLTYENIWLWCGEAGGAKALCPLIERRWQGARDVATPYGFAGFAANVEAEEFLPAWHEFARQHGWICGYLGLHPLLDRRSYPADQTHRANHVYALDLSPSSDAIENKFSDNLQKRLQEWERSGAQLTRDIELCRRFFCTEYAAFAQRVQASAAYEFSTATLSALFDHPNVFAIGGVGAQGLEAVSVFGYTRDCGEYLFNVALASGRHHSARLLTEGIGELKRRGVSQLNLGGGIQPNDGLDAFKARFGGERVPLRALKQVYDAVTYQRCCAAVGIAPAEAQMRSGYFPAYRKALMKQAMAG